MYIPNKPSILLSFFAISTAAVFFFPKKTFFERFVKPASAQSLALIRVMTCLTALLLSLWEDPISVALLPRELAMHKMGFMDYLTMQSASFDYLFSNPFALTFLKITTVTALFLSLIGYRTRVFLVIGFLSYLIFSGVIRIYFWFFHQGIIALYLLGILCFLPCSDAWSVDAYLRKRKSLPAKGNAYVYGWGRYLCWMVIVFPYVLAGISKIKKGGLEWFYPQNLLNYMLSCTLSPMQFDFGVSFVFLKLPLFVVTLVAIFSVMTEISAVLLLLNRRAHLIVPFLLMSLHLGILFMQNIFFPDLIFLLLMFPVGYVVSKRTDPKEYSSSAKMLPYLAAALTGFFITVSIFSIKQFPVSPLMMFTTIRSEEPVIYHRLYLTDLSGRRQIARPEKEIRSLQDTRYRRFLMNCFETKPHLKNNCNVFLRTYAGLLSKNKRYNEIRQIEVEEWRWDYQKAPNDPNFGSLQNWYIYPIKRKSP